MESNDKNNNKLNEKKKYTRNTHNKIIIITWSTKIFFEPVRNIASQCKDIHIKVNQLANSPQTQ